MTIENEGCYAIQDGNGFASVYAKDIPGAGGQWFADRAAAQTACDRWNEEHRPSPTDNAGPETCTQCGDHVGHLLFDEICANCRNANLRAATVQLD